jgi:hypothetical protein
MGASGSSVPVQGCLPGPCSTAHRVLLATQPKWPGKLNVRGVELYSMHLERSVAAARFGKAGQLVQGCSKAMCNSICVWLSLVVLLVMSCLSGW